MNFYLLTNMMKKFLMILILSILILQVVSAIDTEIKIKTPSFTEVHLTILDSSTTTFNALSGPHKITSDYYGDMIFTYSGDESVFNLMVILKKGGERIYSEKFENNYKAGKSIYLEIIPEGYELIETPGALNTTNVTLTNETLINSTEELNETNTTIERESINNSVISGFSIFSGKGFFSLKTFSYIIGFILLLALAFFTFRFMKTRKTPRIKITKLSEMKASQSENKDSSKESNINKIIQEAEEKIKIAQEEISGLKKQQRIKELKERMLKDKEALEDLSRG